MEWRLAKKQLFKGKPGRRIRYYIGKLKFWENIQFVHRNKNIGKLGTNHKRRWYHNIYFEFYLAVPFLLIQTRLFKEAVERMIYDICRLRIELTRPHIWKMTRKTYKFEFQLYKRPLL